MNKKISIIYPICGMPEPDQEFSHPHPFLLTSLNSIIFNNYNNYEVLIGIDGERPWLLSYLEWWKKNNKLTNSKVKIFTFPFTGTYGNNQRNLLLKKATGDLLCFMDQDDCFEINSFSNINNFSKIYPGSPLIFKLKVYMFGCHSIPTMCA